MMVQSTPARHAQILRTLQLEPHHPLYSGGCDDALRLARLILYSDHKEQTLSPCVDLNVNATTVLHRQHGQQTTPRAGREHSDA